MTVLPGSKGDLHESGLLAETIREGISPMADPLDVTRIDPLPGRSARDGVDSLRRPADRQRQKRRRPPHQREPQGDEEEDRQVGTKLDIRV